MQLTFAGNVLFVEHGTAWIQARRVVAQKQVRVAHAQAARWTPEMVTHLPQRGANSRPCIACNGTGILPGQEGDPGDLLCSCGLGWLPAEGPVGSMTEPDHQRELPDRRNRQCTGRCWRECARACLLPDSPPCTIMYSRQADQLNGYSAIARSVSCSHWKNRRPP